MGALKQANPTTTLDNAGPASGAVGPPPENGDEGAIYDELALGTNPAGYIELSPSQTNYVGSAHWMAIMRNVRLNMSQVARFDG
jgi:hypothetical protein